MLFCHPSNWVMSPMFGVKTTKKFFETSNWRYSDGCMYPKPSRQVQLECHQWCLTHRVSNFGFNSSSDFRVCQNREGPHLLLTRAIFRRILIRFTWIWPASFNVLPKNGKQKQQTNHHLPSQIKKETKKNKQLFSSVFGGDVFCCFRLFPRNPKIQTKKRRTPPAHSASESEASNNACTCPGNDGGGDGSWGEFSSFSFGSLMGSCNLHMFGCVSETFRVGTKTNTHHWNNRINDRHLVSELGI